MEPARIVRFHLNLRSSEYSSTAARWRVPERSGCVWRQAAPQTAPIGSIDLVSQLNSGVTERHSKDPPTGSVASHAHGAPRGMKTAHVGRLVLDTGRGQDVDDRDPPPRPRRTGLQ
jgi:hypothetical protein